MIRVLVVDDSATARQLLRHILSADCDLQVVGEATSGAEAVRLTKSLPLDAICSALRDHCRGISP